MTEGAETPIDVSLTSPSVTAARRHLPLAGEELSSVDRWNVACPGAVVAIEQHLRGHLAAPDDVAQRIEEAGFVFADAIDPGARGEAGVGDVEHGAGDIGQPSATRQRRVERHPRHRIAQRLPFGEAPALHQVPRRIERRVVVEQTDPEGGQGADTAPRTAIGAAHLEEGLQPHFGEGGGQMIVPVVQRRLFTGEDAQLALQEVAERQTGGIDVATVAVDEVHRHIEHIVGIAFVPEAVFEHEGQHAGSRWACHR
ncbi:hypothetical protein WR25_19509 [Diploscapter pachys]|uniref:Uncharacterized protein n=1 Tax=Diploscapter pachys TaxID=2018661 RepID=A0A2A2KH76_9BILA|nr:hypothetical protein WR25_19509 [Diploscapter pachys]